MTDKKPGFWQRMFGMGKPELAKKEPPAPKPTKKEPPSQEPAQKEPPERRRAPKKTKAAEASQAPGAATKLKAPPPAGPAAASGVRPPDERQPGTRKKGTPDDTHRPKSKRPGPGSGQQSAEPVWPVPPPRGPGPADVPQKDEIEAPKAPIYEPPKPDEDAGSNS
jgi:hypothetical protein